MTVICEAIGFCLMCGGSAKISNGGETRNPTVGVDSVWSVWEIGTITLAALHRDVLKQRLLSI